jgi:hypothetical protein
VSKRPRRKPTPREIVIVNRFFNPRSEPAPMPPRNKYAEEQGAAGAAWQADPTEENWQRFVDARERALRRALRQQSH